MTDGSKVPLGELKDHYQSYQAKLGELISRENETVKQRNEVNDLLGYVQNLPPELVAQVKQQQQHYMEREHSRMLDAIPEFKDATQFKVAKDAIFALGDEYGVTDVFQNVSNHRVIKMLHDFARLKQGIAAARAGVKPVRAPDPKSTKPKPTSTLDAVTAKAKQTGAKADQIAAVNLLLG